MPKTWTTAPQAAWLETKLPGFVDARTRGRSTAYAKGVHHSFSELWPELDDLFETKAGQPPINLNALGPSELAVYKKKRGAQINSWLQRHSTQRGRLANRAVKQLLRNHAPRRRRAYQTSEVYNKMYPEKVNAVYQERKVEGLSRGKRLNLIKKISDELFANETDEVKELVEKEKEKRRSELEATLNPINGDGGEVDLDDLTIQQYIDQLPELLTSVLSEIGKYCPDWGFLLLASGPMPKANNDTHVFDIYTGPKTIEGYSFAEAHEDFDVGLRIPFGNFVEAGIVDKVKREEAKKALDDLHHTIEEGPGEDFEEVPPVVSETEDEEDDTPALVPVDSEDEENAGESPVTSRRRPSQTLPDSDESEDELSSLDEAPPKHPLEEWPIEGSDSDGEPEVDVVEKKNTKVSRSQREPSATHGSESHEVEPPQVRSKSSAEKRAEATRKRLDTRKKNKAKKDAEIKAAKEVEVEKKTKELEAAKGVEAAKKAKQLVVTKSTKEVDTQDAEKAHEQDAVVTFKSKNASSKTVTKGKARKTPKPAAAAMNDTQPNEGADVDVVKNDSNPPAVVDKDKSGDESPAQGDATLATKRRPPPAIIPPTRVAASKPTAQAPTSPDPEAAPTPKPKGKKSKGGKRQLEDENVAEEPAAAVTPAKRPRRQIVAPKPADAEVSYAKKARSRRA
ncbi:hypothetical protein BDN72DRAFT_855359 [Pluteus cervinus]|uniref:Uncharacterized protein n=1 Tax=Pluteus cervinus TaxID=181527 RepID=A0ACD3B2Z2_9AGAR|nr:hypothetical protein BDN72DRAFT_855359 [Pluteus cervinus]